MDAAKKDCILLQAARAFARFGFKKASIDEIAREAGVGKGTVYLAAESKEDLFYQVLHREVRAWQAECARTIDPREPAPELLRRLLGAAMEYVQKHPLVLDLLHGETLRTLPDWADFKARFAKFCGDSLDDLEISDAEQQSAYEGEAVPTSKEAEEAEARAKAAVGALIGQSALAVEEPM